MRVKIKYNLFYGRYIFVVEAAYRIFGFNVHYRSTLVLRLSFHLPGKKIVHFDQMRLHKKWRYREGETYLVRSFLYFESK